MRVASLQGPDVDDPHGRPRLSRCRPRPSPANGPIARHEPSYDAQGKRSDGAFCVIIPANRHLFGAQSVRHGKPTMTHACARARSRAIRGPGGPLGSPRRDREGTSRRSDAQRTASDDAFLTFSLQIGTFWCIIGASWRADDDALARLGLGAVRCARRVHKLGRGRFAGNSSLPKAGHRKPLERPLGVESNRRVHLFAMPVTPSISGQVARSSRFDCLTPVRRHDPHPQPEL